MNTGCKRLVLGIGNRLRCDDAAGSIIAESLALDGFCSIDAEFMPENYLSVIRRCNPEIIVLVDACDMALTPGEVRRININALKRGAITTHSLPLDVVIQELQKITNNIHLIGIQPEHVDVGETISTAVQKAIEYVIDIIKSGDEEKICML